MSGGGKEALTFSARAVRVDCVVCDRPTTQETVFVTSQSALFFKDDVF